MVQIAPPAPSVLTKEEAARELRVDIRTITRWVVSGRLRSVSRPGRLVRIPRDAVEALLQERLR